MIKPPAAATTLNTLQQFLRNAVELFILMGGLLLILRAPKIEGERKHGA